MARHILSALVIGSFAVSGCSLFRPAPDPVAETSAPAWTASQGRVALSDTQYDYRLHTSSPMIAQPADAGGTVTLGPAGADVAPVPVLVLNRAGDRMGQDDHGEIRRVAAFLCAERQDWPRGGASQATPDWIADGRWHIVGPCAEAAPPQADTVIAADTAPPGVPPSVWAAPEGAVGPFMSTASP